MGLRHVQDVSLPEGTVSKSIVFDFAPASGERLFIVLAHAASETVVSTGWAQEDRQILDSGTWVAAFYSKVSDGTETSFDFTQNGARSVRAVVWVLDNVTDYEGSGVDEVGNALNIANVPDPSTDVAASFSSPSGYQEGVLLRTNMGIVQFGFPLPTNSMDPAGDLTEFSDGYQDGANEKPYLSAYAAAFDDGDVNFDLDHTNWGSDSYNAINIWVETDASLPGSPPVSGYDNPIHEENDKAGDTTSVEPPVGNGVVGYLGYSKQYSVNVGETIDFAVDGNDAAEIDVYRIGHYGGAGKRLVTTLTNTPTDQASGSVVADSNGGTDMAWATTASWAVPASTVSGMFLGVVKASNGTPQAWIPFIVRDDTRPVDVVVMTSDATWGAAYNYFGNVGTEKSGKSVYGSGGPLGSIADRTHFVSYNRPIVSRPPTAGGNVVNHWDAQELALYDWLEENGYNVRYIGSYDLDQDRIGDASIFISCGHDEYWSQGMRDNVEAFRDTGGHVLFMAGNHIFWRIRWTPDGRGFWCYKDTMSGPGAHVAGTPLDPVSWTGTWKDTRRPDPPGPEHEYTTTGDSFRMNGINNLTMTVVAADYGSSPFWRDTSVETGTDLVVPEVVGFEANQYMPPDSGAVRLANTVANINGSVAGPNGENYSGNGDLDWSPVMFLATPTSGMTVGFGTTQWQWGLSNRHERGSGTVANVAMRQATTNLLYDFGVTAPTIQNDLVEPTPVALSTYGVTYTGVDPENPGVPPGGSGGSIWYPEAVAGTAQIGDFTGYLLATQFQVTAVETVTRLWYYKASDQALNTTIYLADYTNEVILGQTTLVSAQGETGWVGVDLPVPVVLTVGDVYGSVIVIPSAFNYTQQSGVFTGDVVNGTIAAQQGLFWETQIPTADAVGWNTFNNSSYYVDVGLAIADQSVTPKVGAANQISGYVGSTPVIRAYLGETLVYGSAP